MSKELKTTQSNDAIQFVQGISSKNLDNVAITPGTIYFFDDGSIIWDHETNGENKRSMMSGQTFIYSAGQSYTQDELKNESLHTSLYKIPKSNSTNALYDTPWIEAQSNWIPLVSFKEWTNHQNVPNISLPKTGTYDIIIHLQQGVISKINAQGAVTKTPIENIYYHGTFTLLLEDKINRGCDEILLSRGGGQGMIQSHYLYLRLYGNDSANYTFAPTQLQIASNADLDITKLSITLRKIN